MLYIQTYISLALALVILYETRNGERTCDWAFAM